MCRKRHNYIHNNYVVFHYRTDRLQNAPREGIGSTGAFLTPHRELKGAIDEVSEGLSLVGRGSFLIGSGLFRLRRWYLAFRLRKRRLQHRQKRLKLRLIQGGKPADNFPLW